ncbi:response regulator [Paraburkholderia sp. IMGN_8]|uniref:response regulator n=1 Tax=Paraburkholderia sp. IMGN_8 TaxID=3136564 RepID=UPI0031018D48
MATPAPGDRTMQGPGNINCGAHVSVWLKMVTDLVTLLLVDDDPNILRPLRLLLEPEGYRVLKAPDGQAALAAIATERPTLIVTDWMMPRTDGVGLCRRLKDDAATADIPVVMLSAASPPYPTEPLWDVLLPKPTLIARLIREIRTLLKGRGSSASAHALKR